MVVVGADVHKRTHTFVAVDQAGRELGHKTFDADSTGHRKAVALARERFGVELSWAIEDCRHLSARLERGRTHYQKKKSEGMSTPEAPRCLKRRLARIAFNHPNTDHAASATGLAATA
jgi:hypothetical protein